MYGRGRASQFLAEKHFLMLGPESGKIGWFEKVQYLQKKAWRKPKWMFHNLGNLLRPLELISASRERLVPTEWQVRAVLGDCRSRAKVVPAQGQSCDVNRDVVSQLPPEAGHPIHCCKTEETCIWHERCSQTLVEHS